MKRILAVLVAIGLFLSLALPVHATTITNPDSISILSAKVVRNTVESGDWAVAFHFKIAYTTTNFSSEIYADQSFYLNLYDALGTTILSSTVPFVYIDYGYMDNWGGFYFPASSNMTWGAGYQIKISPNPLYFASPPDTYTYTLGAADYSTKTTQTDNQNVMENYLRGVCKKFETAYTGLDLLTTTDVGEVLTTDGENWIRGAIPGVASIAPRLFYIQYFVPQTQDMQYNNSLSVTYANRSASWDVRSGLEWAATETGLDSAGTVAVFIFAIISLVFTVFCGWKGWGIEPGLIGSMNILTLGALLFGGTILNIVLFGALIAGIFVFFILFLRRA